MSTPLVPAGHQDVFAACVAAAADFGAPVVRRVVARGAKLMLEQSVAALDARERRTRADAGELLGRHQDALRAAYPEALRREFGGVTQEPAARPRDLSFESLELMGEEQLDETVELVRAGQVVRSATEGELVQLNALVSAARGNKVVRASDNPLQPEAWVRALRHATLQCPVPSRIRICWMQHLSDALGVELPSVYRQLADLLRQQGVSAASFGVHAAVGGAAGAPATVAPQPGPQSESLLNLRDLRRLLAGDGTGERVSQQEAVKSVAGAPETMGATVPWALEALKEVKNVDQVVQRIRQASTRGAGGLSTGPQTTGSSTPAQALGEEVVKVMVENMAADARLLPQVQQAVRDLEPALLRLANNDPRFFRDKEHPARRLLTELTQRSLAWSSPDMQGFAAFFEPLGELVSVLARLPIENSEPFEFALDTLQQTWREQEERQRRRAALSAQVLIKAETRNLMAQTVADEMRARADFAAAPAVVRRFLTEPWAQVIAAAQIEDTSGAADPGGYVAIVNDLIWTAQPQLTAENPARLAKLMPPMLATLRQGLANIEYPQDEVARFLNYLGEQRAAVLGQPDAATSPVAASASDTVADAQPTQPIVWLEPSEAREAALMDDVPDTVTEWTFDSQGPAPHSRRELASADATAALRPGLWLDVFLQGTWSRWQLTWASPHGLLYMFTDGAGRSRSVTRSTFDKLIAAGAVRVLPEQPVVEDALDAVAAAALRNSAKSGR
jgi:hypothetical protein